MYLLLLASVVSLAIAIERGISLRWTKVIPSSLEGELDAYPGPSRGRGLRESCLVHSDAPAGRLLLHILDREGWPRAEAVDSAQMLARKETSRLERGLAILEVIVSVAPLLGLVGTVFGLIVLFDNIGETMQGDSGELARGIAIALNTTLLGLLVAIFTMVALSWLRGRVESLIIELETLCDSLIQKIHGRPLPGREP